MSIFFETVLMVLESDERFVSEDGTFLRNVVYTAAMKMDEGLIRLLLTNDKCVSVNDDKDATHDVIYKGWITPPKITS